MERKTIIRIFLVLFWQVPHSYFAEFEKLPPHYTPYISHSSHRAPMSPSVHKSLPTSYPPRQLGFLFMHGSALSFK